MAVFGILNGLACLIPIAMPQNFEEVCLKHGDYPPDAWPHYRKKMCLCLFLWSLFWALVVLDICYSLPFVQAATAWLVRELLFDPSDPTYQYLLRYSEVLIQWSTAAKIGLGIMAVGISLKLSSICGIRWLWRSLLSPLFLLIFLVIIVGCYSIH